MNEKPHYVAFISHRSNDKQFVFWLQKKLEHYPVGRKIRYRYDLPTGKVAPLCVDSYEFASNELKNEIAQKLDDSAKMILICSHASANPVPGGLDWKDDPSMVEDWSADPHTTGWVGYEIDYMLKQGRQKDIIPVVIEGDTGKGDCFHPLMKDIMRNDLLYFDFTKFKKTPRLIFLKLTAAVIGIKNLSEIYDHDARRKRILRTAASVLALALAAFGIWSWSYFLPHTKHYSDYVLINGLPSGLEELSGGELRETAEHYTITTTKASHRLVLSHVNASMTPVPEQSILKAASPMIAVYQCRDNWKPDTVEYRDRNDIVQMTYAYATDMRYVTFQENEYTSDQVYPSTDVDEYGIPVRMKIDRYDLTFDDEGHMVRRMYMSGVNYVIDETGTAGEQFTYDGDGRTKSLRYLNRELEVAANQNGVAGLDYEYDQEGRLVSAVFVNASGEPVYGTDWYSSVRYSYSDRGQIVETVYYTPEGEETICSGGYSRATAEYDAAGNKISEYFTQTDGSPAYSREKYHMARYAYNGKGDMVSAAYFDEKQKPLLHADGYSSMTWERDGRGNPLKTCYYATTGDLMPSATYAAEIRRKYNSQGFLTEETNYGTKGNAIITADGYFRKAVTCDSRGKPVDLACYGFDDLPVYHRDGYHRMHFDYDDRENLSVITLYGTSGQLIPFDGFWAVQKRSYNGGGQVTAVSFYDQYEKPMVANGSYASLENVYDDRGLLTSTAYFDSAGHLMKGTSILQGNVLKGDRAYAKVEYEYDENGSVVRKTLIGEDGGPADLFAPVETYVYDEAGRKTEQYYYGADGNLTDYYEAIRLYAYNEEGAEVLIENYDREGNPCNGINGYFSAYTEKDPRGNVTEIRLTDRKGKLIGTHRHYIYDDRGVLTATRHTGEDGKPVMSENGYAALVVINDQAGRPLKSTALDTSGRPVTAASGFCTQEYVYDTRGLNTGMLYYGPDGEAVNVPAGYHRFELTYNDYGKLERAEFYDREGVSLFHYTAAYKDYLYPVDEALFGRNGELIQSGDYGIAAVKSTYDENNQKTSASYYDTEGSLHLLLFMFAGWKSEYKNGQEVSRCYYGTDGNPMMIDSGFAMVTMERNSKGQEVRRTYLDENEEPVNNLFGFSVMEVTYDETGEIASSAFYDKEGNAVEPDGEASLDTLSLYGETSEEKIFNPDTGDYVTFYRAIGSSTVRLLVFRSFDGKTDQYLQPDFRLFEFSSVSDYISRSARSYIPQISEEDETVDISGNINAEDWKSMISDYISCLEEGDTDRMVGLMDLSSVNAAVDLLSDKVNTPRTEEEFLTFYRDYWDGEMQRMKKDLTEKYGEDYKISYEFLSFDEYGPEEMAEFNRYFEQQLGTDPGYTGMTSLNIRYFVKGAKGSGMETEGYLTPSLVLFKTDRGWSLGSGNGFPAPGSDALLEFCGGVKK